MDMRVLVIPDVHLKTDMLEMAEEIMKTSSVDMAIFLGDIPDNWGCQGKIDMYKATYDGVMDFKRKYPNTKFCYGNHDIAYWLSLPCSGTDIYNIGVVANMIGELQQVYGQDATIIHQIDDVLFSHAGLTSNYIHRFFSREVELNISDKDLIERINYLDDKDRRLWDETSPIWARPQHQESIPKFSRLYMWKPETYMQVVGHTPLIHPEQEQNLLSCDVFSTRPNGELYGLQEWVIVDTKMQTWEIYNGTDRESDS